MRNVIAYADAGLGAVELTVEDGARSAGHRGQRARLRPRDPGAALAEGHLGLSLVEELVRESGGSLDVSSSEGAGTRVELEVPAR